MFPGGVKGVPTRSAGTWLVVPALETTKFPPISPAIVGEAPIVAGSERADPATEPVDDVTTVTVAFDESPPSATFPGMTTPNASEVAAVEYDATVPVPMATVLPTAVSEPAAELVLRVEQWTLVAVVSIQHTKYCVALATSSGWVLALGESLKASVTATPFASNHF